MNLKIIFHQLKSPPVQVSLIIALLFLLGNSIPEILLQGLLTASLSIKSLLSFFLPWLVFSFIYLSLSQMKKGVLSFIFFLLSFIILSNFIANLVGFSLAQVLILIPEFCPSKPSSAGTHLLPFFTFDLPTFLPTKGGLIAGFVLGFFSRFFDEKSVFLSQKVCSQFIQLFIGKFFVPVLPFFIGGFVAKLNFEGSLNNMITDYGLLILLIIVSQLFYCFVLSVVATSFNFSVFLKFLKDMIPPYLTGMMTMSGAAALPLSIQATKKHLNSPATAEGFLPPATNVHLLGDGISVPFLIIALLISCGKTPPAFSDLIMASLYMAFLRFGIVSIPGGGIFVMIPLLEGTFGFSNEMTGLITAIYILFDLFNTANNVLANGASTLIFDHLWSRLKQTRSQKN